MRYFWFASAMVDRIRAQEDMRSMGVASTSGATEEYVKTYTERLLVEIGTVVKMKGNGQLDAPRDEVGFNELRNMV